MYILSQCQRRRGKNEVWEKRREGGKRTEDWKIIRKGWKDGGEREINPCYSAE